MRVSKYKVPEKIFDVNQNKKITTEEFIKKYLPKNTIKLISRLNNKVAVQNDDNVKLFSLKDEDESRRFLENLNDYLIDNGRGDAIIVIETSKPQKKYLYDILSGMGFSKQSLYRRSTTYKPR
jgi:hypothetical protein